MFRRRWIAAVAFLLTGAVTGVFLLSYVLAGEIYDYQDTVDGVHFPEVDAIICLAGGRGRISAAGDIWYRYWEQAHGLVAAGRRAPRVPILYISGMGPQSNWNVLTKQVRRGVLDVLKPEDVILETESFNTDANARWVDLHARQAGWSHILLVTSPYHMKRARFIFEQILGDSSASVAQPIAIDTLSVYQEPFDLSEWRQSYYGVKVTLLEYFKWIRYRYFWKA